MVRGIFLAAVGLLVGCATGDNNPDAQLPDAGCANGLTPPTWYADHDGDGVGVASETMEACTAPVGFVDTAGDCVDTNRFQYPGALERCDAVDTDCDPTTLELCPMNCTPVRQAADADNEERLYLICSTPIKWTAAALVCQSEGQMLVKIDDADEKVAVLSHAIARMGAVPFWIGGSDAAVADTWIWPDGVEFWQGKENGASVGGAYNNWRAGEPNDDGTEACAASLSDGLWVDTTCNSNYPFVCERPQD